MKLVLRSISAELRELDDIIAELDQLEKRADGMIGRIMEGVL